MSDIMKLIKGKLKGSTTMPAGTGQAPGHTDVVHPLGHHDPQAHHHHVAGCCGHDHEHRVLHDHCHPHMKADDAELIDDEGSATHGHGCC